MGLLARRLEANTAGMHEWYPSLTPSPPHVNQAAAAWEGIVFPLASTTDDEWPMLASDLDQHEEVWLTRGGGVHHHRSCTTMHQQLQPPIRGIASFQISFRIRATLPRPPAVPYVQVLEPEVSRKLFPNHPHILTIGDIDVACPSLPSFDPFDWQRNTIVDYLDKTMLWLVRHAVWAQTGTWLGKGWPHDPRILACIIDRRSPCPCGSGKWYLACHWYEHRRMAGLPTKLDLPEVLSK